jgi:uncharacterized protein YjbJ (UPF0337 family)
MGEFIDKAKGAANEAIGKAKQHSGDQQTRAEGVVQEAKGEGQKIMGDVKGKLGDKI